MNRTHFLSSGILGLGIAAWAGMSCVLRSDGFLEFEPNILTLKGIPFGRTVAVAMRGPVDVYWNAGESHAHGGHDCSGSDCAHAGHGGGGQQDLLNSTRSMAEMELVLPPEDSLRGKALGRIDDWKAAYYTRTNPFGSSKVHRTFIMGETEKKLRLSYEMDPSNFAAYGSYFLFLSEALSTFKQEGEEEVVQQQAVAAALELSRHTVRYCLALGDEPSALLTAAAAAHDYLQTRYTAGGSGTMPEIIQFLQIQHQCLEGFSKVRGEMVAKGTWERLPAVRREEMDVQNYLLGKLLEGNMQMIQRNANQGMSPNNQSITSS
jgi:hypothetical protein